MSNVYDVIIIGGGPAGLAAGLYAGRSRLNTLLIEQGQDGGQIATTDDVENYPGGSVEGETGPDLIKRFTAQAERFGVERVNNQVTEVSLKGEIKKVHTLSEVYEAHCVIIATGAQSRKVGCPGEEELTGRGVSYCATCDANFFTDLEVFVVGGGDSAVEEAMYLTKYARKVTVIHRRDELRAAKSIQERAFKNEKLHFMWNAVVDGFEGEDILSAMTVKDTKTGEIRRVEADEDDGVFGCFIYVGTVPKSQLFEKELALEYGYIRTNDEMETSLPGVYAAGDIRVKSLRQVITAAADGAIAAMQCEKYLAEKKG